MSKNKNKNKNKKLPQSEKTENKPVVSKHKEDDLKLLKDEDPLVEGLLGRDDFSDDEEYEQYLDEVPLNGDLPGFNHDDDEEEDEALQGEEEALQPDGDYKEEAESSGQKKLREAKLANMAQLQNYLFPSDEERSVLGKILEDIESSFTPEENPEYAVFQSTFYALLAQRRLEEKGITAGIKFTSEDIEEMAPFVASRIQKNLDLLRPSGKHAARLEMCKQLEARRETHAFHVIDKDGNFGRTAYLFVSGNEEFVTSLILPGTATNQTFKGLSLKSRSPQLKLEKCLRVFAWNELENGFVISETVKLVDGYHPDRKPENESEGFTVVPKTETLVAQEIHLNDASDDVFTAISNAAQTSLEDAIGLCIDHGVSYESIYDVMSSNNFTFDSVDNRYVPFQDNEVVTHHQQFNSLPLNQPSPPRFKGRLANLSSTIQGNKNKQGV